jgi:hypothetical protein
MSDDPTQFPDDPAASESQEIPASEPQVQPEAPQAQVTSTPAEPVAVPQPSEQVQYPPVPDTYIQPAAAQPQYPPTPELYRQQPQQPVQPEVPSPYAPQQPPATPNPYAVPYSAPQAGYPMSPYTTPYSGSGFPPPFGYAPIPQAQPLPLSQAIRELPGQYKKILFKPGAATFAEEQGKAEWGIIWMQILFLTVFQAVVSFVTYFYIDQGSAAAATTAGVSASFFSTILQFEALLGVILVPGLFFIGVGIQCLFAKMFKGQGLFRQQAYNQLLYQVPLGIISSALSLIVSPLVKPLTTSMFNFSPNAATPAAFTNPGVMVALLLLDVVSLGLFVYSVILNVFAIMAAHRLSGGKATGAVLIPYGILFAVVILAVCALMVVAISAAASLH